MKSFFRKPFRFALCWAAALLAMCTLTLLDAFVIPRGQASADTSAEAVDAAYRQAANQLADAAGAGTLLTDSLLTDSVAQDDGASAATLANPIVTDTSYDDGSTKITIGTYTLNGTTYYVADVQVQDASSLLTAFAGGEYGRNITATTSQIASSVNAVLAVNGDYYGFRDTGYVLRNGVIYRSTSSGNDALVIDAAGDFSVVDEDSVSLETLKSQGAWQVLSFGPGLVENGAVAVDGNDEVSRSRSSNPRTAIGQIGANHYVLVVSDGRTSESAGFSLLELAQVMQSLGCETAYNLDGGGSSTMVFMGRVVNRPTSSGRTIQERGVSDIVAICA